MVFGRDRIEYKTLDQIRTMRRAGLVVAAIHDAIRQAIRPGMTTAGLDAIARQVLESHQAGSNFLGYHGFPATICTSINNEVVHGIPSDRQLQAGDVVSVDAGATVADASGRLWHGDAAVTYVLGQQGPLADIGLQASTGLGAGSAPGDAGEASHVEGGQARAALELNAVTQQAMWAGIAALATGKRVGDVGIAVDRLVTSQPGTYGIVEDYTGHGIGTAMHQPPDVPNYASSHRGPALKSGMCLCVEPMITAGSAATQELADGWTVTTVDGSLAAHWEHTVAITDAGISVLTAADYGAQGLRPWGITPVQV